MRTIAVRNLHIKTGEWVRKAASGEDVVITDRGRPVATLAAVDDRDLGTPYSRRRTLAEFEALPSVRGESTRHVSEDRSRG